MPRFYFDIFDDSIVEDPEGQQLGGLAIAHQKAVSYAREMAAEEVRQGAVDLIHKIVIGDEDHEPILAVTFRQAFAITY